MPNDDLFAKLRHDVIKELFGGSVLCSRDPKFIQQQPGGADDRTVGFIKTVARRKTSEFKIQLPWFGKGFNSKSLGKKIGCGINFHHREGEIKVLRAFLGFWQC